MDFSTLSHYEKEVYLIVFQYFPQGLTAKEIASEMLRQRTSTCTDEELERLLEEYQTEISRKSMYRFN